MMEGIFAERKKSPQDASQETWPGREPGVGVRRVDEQSVQVGPRGLLEDLL